MIKAEDLITITTNRYGQKRLELNREVFDKMDKHQKDTFTELYSKWFLLAREEYAEHIGEDYGDYVTDFCVNGYDNDKDFQDQYNTDNTRAEFLEYYENGDFDKIPELKEMERDYDEMYLQDIIDSDFEYATFLIATDYYGQASQFIDVVHAGISRLWECSAPFAALDADYMFYTEKEELLMSITDENIEGYEEEWLAFAEKLISKFPNVDIEKVYNWVVENVPVYDLDELKIGRKWLSYEGSHKYSLAA